MVQRKDNIFPKFYTKEQQETNRKILKLFSELCQSPYDHEETSKKTKEALDECLNQTKTTTYISDVEKVSMSYSETASQITQFIVSPKSHQITMFDEMLIVDEIGLLGNLGGLLGLFVGFSIFGYVSIVLDAIVDGTRPEGCTNPSA